MHLAAKKSGVLVVFPKKGRLTIRWSEGTWMNEWLNDWLDTDVFIPAAADGARNGLVFNFFLSALPELFNNVYGVSEESGSTLIFA